MSAIADPDPADVKERRREDGHSLLEDAELVLRYATRAGLLISEALAKAIDQYHASLIAREPPSRSGLTTALNEAVRAIAPMTLIDLRAGRSPFDPANEAKFARLQRHLSILTVTLVFLIAFYMHSLHREQAALDAIGQLQEMRAFEKLSAVRKLAQFGGALDKKDWSSDQYHQKVGEWFQTQDRISASENAVRQASTMNLVPFQREAEAAWNGLYSLFATAQGNGSNGAHDGGAQPLSKIDDPCTYLDESGVELQGFASYPPWLRKVAVDALADFCFSIKVRPGGVAQLIYTAGINTFAPQRKERIEMYSGWLLPFLYGMLGSAVFLMRNLLNARTPNIEGAGRIARLALGGTAGIIIGWFCAPIGASNPAVGALSSVPFALAFLTGFCIDTLFAYLDKFARTANVGASSPSPPAHPPRHEADKRREHADDERK